MASKKAPVVILADDFDMAKAVQEKRFSHIKYTMKTDEQIAEEIRRKGEALQGSAANISTPTLNLETIKQELGGFLKKSYISTPTLNLETIKQELGGFLKKSYKEAWNDISDQIAQAGEKPLIIRPQNIEWETTVNIDASKFGEFTVNPDTASINWDSVPMGKIKVFAFAEFVGKKRWELAKYISTEWSDRDKHLIPGIEYWKYVFENPDKVSDLLLKDGNWYYFFGSIFRHAVGRWGVPVVYRDGALFRRHGNLPDYLWNTGDRVVLLEK